MDKKNIARKLAKEILIARSVVSEKLHMGYTFQGGGGDTATFVVVYINYYDREQRKEAEEHFGKKVKEFAAIAKKKGWNMVDSKLELLRSGSWQGSMYFRNASVTPDELWSTLRPRIKK